MTVDETLDRLNELSRNHNLCYGKTSSVSSGPTKNETAEMTSHRIMQHPEPPRSSFGDGLPHPLQNASLYSFAEEDIDESEHGAVKIKHVIIYNCRIPLP